MSKVKKVGLFECTKPCGNCPYRKDAPLRHWHIEEYKKLLRSENDYFGSVFHCHKNNGSICIGWLMKQDENRLPSIALRMQLSKHNITVEYLDSLKCSSPLYKDVREMIQANYPELLIHEKKET